MFPETLPGIAFSSTRYCTQPALLALTGALALAGMIFPQEVTAWRQDIGGSAASGQGEARSVTVDIAGNVVAAGRVNGDLAVIKFDGATGIELWRHLVDGTQVGNLDIDTALAVTVDTTGDVIAAGVISNLGTGEDFIVIKLANGSGAELWRKEINGPAGGVDIARSAAVDAAGDVVVAGNLSETVTGNAFTVIKFAGGSGVEVWRFEISGTTAGGSYNGAGPIVVDTSGDVVAAGVLDNTATGPDFTVIKLSGGSGAELWREEISGTAALGDDEAGAVALDAAGDVMAVGAVENVGSGADFAAIKLSGGSGAELWRREIDFSGDNDWAYSVAVDGVGNVVAGGVINDRRSNRSGIAVKFAGNTGAEIWRQSLGKGRTGAVAIDAATDVIATTDKSNILVSKLAGGTGVPLWQQEIVSPLDQGRFFVSGTVDSSGNAIAAGRRETEATPSFAFTVVDLSGLDGTVGQVRGKKLVVRDNSGDPTKRMLSAVSQDSTIRTSPPGSAGDPIIGGAKLRLLNPATLESAAFTLPAGGWWTGLGNPPGSLGYRYDDPHGANGPCKSLRAGGGKRLGAMCLGRLGTIPFTLDEANQGSLTVSIQLGTAVPQCFTFGGTVVMDHGTANPGPSGVFRAKNSSYAPPSCPVP